MPRPARPPLSILLVPPRRRAGATIRQRRRAGEGLAASALPTMLLATLVAVSLPVARAEVTELDGAALETLMSEGATVIDVRREDEWRERGVLEGAHRLTFFDRRGGYDAESWLAALAELVEPGRPLVLICARGVRSKRIAEFLDERLGMTAVHNVTEGIEGWREDGGEVVPWPPR